MDGLNEDSILEIPKLILIKDLGMMYPTKDSKYKSKFGIYKCGFCGTEFRTNTYKVNAGLVKSCGCYTKKKFKERFTKHGLSNTRLYNILKKIKDRVFRTTNKHYNDYGGRGITICDEWLDIQNFYEWAMENGYEENKGLSIDRIDNNGSYCPENCRWTTPTIQTRNQRIYKNNTSGYKGVSYNKNYKMFVVKINVNRKRIHLGYFKTAIEAGVVYNNYIIENSLEGFILNEIPKEII